MSRETFEPIDEALEDAEARDFGPLVWTTQLAPPPGGVRRRSRRRGPLLLHLFERGLIAERVNGGALSATLESLAAVLVDFDSVDEHGRVLRSHLGLRITFSDGDDWFGDLAHHEDTEALVEVARRCRTMTRTRVTFNKARMMGIRARIAL